MGIVGEALAVVVISLPVGVISSLIASCIAWRLGRCFERRRWRSKYSRSEGEYAGFEFSEADGRQLKAEPVSKARLSYRNDNILSIELTHDSDKRTWRGDIFMETENSGSLAWRYVDKPEEREFGFKRCIFEGTEVYLVDQQTDVYRKEVLKRVQ